MGKALKHLLPSLWPLADSASPAGKAAAAWPPAVHARLLAALAAYPLPAAPAEPAEGAGASGKAAGALELGEQRDLLASALAAVWA